MSFQSIQRVMKTPPRALQLAERKDPKALHPQSPSGVVAKQAEPLMGMVAHGHIPMDEKTARAVGAFLDQQYKQSKQ